MPDVVASDGGTVDKELEKHLDSFVEVGVAEVVHFFCYEIFGVHGGKNIENLREILELKTWYFCQLRQAAFKKLSIPDSPRGILGEKTYEIKDIKSGGYWSCRIRRENRIEPLILKRAASPDPEVASFGILDGSSRAQTYNKFVDSGRVDYCVNAYLGV